MSFPPESFFLENEAKEAKEAAARAPQLAKLEETFPGITTENLGDYPHSYHKQLAESVYDLLKLKSLQRIQSIEHEDEHSIVGIPRIRVDCHAPEMVQAILTFAGRLGPVREIEQVRFSRPIYELCKIFISEEPHDLSGKEYRPFCTAILTLMDGRRVYCTVAAVDYLEEKNYFLKPEKEVRPISLKTDQSIDENSALSRYILFNTEEFAGEWLLNAIFNLTNALKNKLFSQHDNAGYSESETGENFPAMREAGTFYLGSISNVDLSKIEYNGLYRVRIVLRAKTKFDGKSVASFKYQIESQDGQSLFAGRFTIIKAGPR